MLKSIKLFRISSILLAAFLWAFEGIVLLPKLFNLNVSFVVFTLHLIGFLILNLFLFKEFKRIKKIPKKDWIIFFLIALFGGVIGTLSIVKALFLVNFNNLSIVIILQKLQPIFAIILAYFLLGEKPNFKFYFWAILAIISSYFLTFGINLPDFKTGSIFYASLLSLLAAFSFGSATTFGRIVAKKYEFKTIVFYRYGLTTILMFFYVFLFSQFQFEKITEIQSTLLIIIPLTTGLGSMLLYYFGLKKIKASIATICELFFPISAVILDYIVNGNILNIIQWISATIMLFSIFQITTNLNIREIKK